MGQTYSVTLKVKMAEENKVKCVTVLHQNKLLGWCVADTLDQTINNLLFAEEPDTQFTTENDVYDASFDASYTYDSNLLHFMEAIAPYSEDGTVMEVYPDTGYNRYEINDGSVHKYYENECINPYFEDADQMYDNIITTEDGVYNETTNEFITKYSEDGDIIIYRLSKDLARATARHARAGETTWLANLGPGGQIISADEAPEYLDSVLSNAEEEGADEDWIYAGQMADFYALSKEAA